MATKQIFKAASGYVLVFCAYAFVALATLHNLFRNPRAGAQYRGQYFWGGKRVGFYMSGQTYFQNQDWVGTERMRTTCNGGVAGSFTSLPFGDAQTTTAGHDYDAYHFAGMDEDGSTYDAQFRKYNQTQGRWMSPDPYSGSYDFTNPRCLTR